MGEEMDLLERISMMEVQIKDLEVIKNKLDGLYTLITDMKLENAHARSGFATKQECTQCRKDIEHRLYEMEEGRKKLFWAAVAGSITFFVWLVEQLLHVSIKIGG